MNELCWGDGGFDDDDARRQLYYSCLSLSLISFYLSLPFQKTQLARLLPLKPIIITFSFSLYNNEKLTH